MTVKQLELFLHMQANESLGIPYPLYSAYFFLYEAKKTISGREPTYGHKVKSSTCSR